MGPLQQRRGAGAQRHCCTCCSKRWSLTQSSSRRIIGAVPIAIVLLLTPYAFVEFDLGQQHDSPDLSNMLSTSMHYTAHHIDVSTNTSRQIRKQNSPKVPTLYTVFAGRKNRLLLQEPYWSDMYSMGSISEVHLWNYIPLDDNNEENRVDREYLYSLPQKYKFITIMEPSTVPLPETKWYDFSNVFRGNLVKLYTNGSALLKNPNVRGYSEYYKYYSDNPWDGVIIKADDDILYINTTMVKPYVEYLWNRTDIFLLSASVVNQGFCAYHQQRLGAIPNEVEEFELPRNGMGLIHKNGTKAYRLHQHFLASEENRRRFFVPKPEFVSLNDGPRTININFIAIRGDVFHETWELIQGMLKQNKLYYDEGAVTARAIIQTGKIEGVYMPLVVAHASYAHQYKMHREILSLWADWAKRERTDLYGNVLDEWVAPDPFVEERNQISSA